LRKSKLGHKIWSTMTFDLRPYRFKIDSPVIWLSSATSTWKSTNWSYKLNALRFWCARFKLFKTGIIFIWFL